MLIIADAAFRRLTELPEESEDKTFELEDKASVLESILSDETEEEPPDLLHCQGLAYSSWGVLFSLVIVHSKLCWLEKNVCGNSKYTEHLFIKMRKRICTSIEFLRCLCN